MKNSNINNINNPTRSRVAALPREVGRDRRASSRGGERGREERCLLQHGRGRGGGGGGVAAVGRGGDAVRLIVEVARRGVPARRCMRKRTKGAMESGNSQSLLRKSFFQCMKLNGLRLK